MASISPIRYSLIGFIGNTVYRINYGFKRGKGKNDIPRFIFRPINSNSATWFQLVAVVYESVAVVSCFKKPNELISR